jgi:hypothetical protein
VPALRAVVLRAVVAFRRVVDALRAGR